MVARLVRYLRRRGVGSTLRRALGIFASLFYYRCDLVLLVKKDVGSGDPPPLCAGFAIQRLKAKEIDILLRDLAISPRQIRQMTAAGDTCAAVFADGRIAASAWAAFASAKIPEIFYDEPLVPGCGYINTVECARAYRRRGLARAAIREIERTAAEMNIKYLCVGVHWRNTASMALFESLGYRRFRVVHAKRLLGLKTIQSETLDPEWDFLLPLPKAGSPESGFGGKVA